MTNSTMQDQQRIRQELGLRLFQQHVWAHVTTMVNYILGTDDRDAPFTWDDVMNMEPIPDEWGAAQLIDYIENYLGDELYDALSPHSIALLYDLESDDLDEISRFEPHSLPTAEMIDDCDEALDDLREFVRDHANRAEVYEWWIVPDWLFIKLAQAGEVVIVGEFIWGRQATGQAVYMDDVIQQIAVDLYGTDN